MARNSLVVRAKEGKHWQDFSKLGGKGGEWQGREKSSWSWRPGLLKGGGSSPRLQLTGSEMWGTGVRAREGESGESHSLLLTHLHTHIDRHSHTHTTLPRGQTHAHIYTHITHLHAHAHMFINTHACTHVHRHPCSYNEYSQICTHNAHTRSDMHSHTHPHTHVYINTLDTLKYTHIYTLTHTHLDSYAYTQIYTVTHTRQT